MSLSFRGLGMVATAVTTLIIPNDLIEFKSDFAFWEKGKYIAKEVDCAYFGCKILPYKISSLDFNPSKKVIELITLQRDERQKKKDLENLKKMPLGLKITLEEVVSKYQSGAPIRWHNVYQLEGQPVIETTYEDYDHSNPNLFDSLCLPSERLIIGLKTHDFSEGDLGSRALFEAKVLRALSERGVNKEDGERLTLEAMGVLEFDPTRKFLTYSILANNVSFTLPDFGGYKICLSQKAN